jgi:hypothetical protein
VPRPILPEAQIHPAVGGADDLAKLIASGGLGRKK